MNGRPLDLRWAWHVPAILDIWSGTQGGHWPLLFGEVSPSGKLPFSWRAPSGRCPSSTPTPAPMSRRTRGDATGTSPAPPVPVRARPQPAGSAIPTSPSTARRSPGGTVTVSVRSLHLGPRSRRGRPALPPPTPRLRLPDRSASSRLPTRHPGIPGVPAGAVHDRSRAPALLEHHRTGLGPRELHLRRLGRRLLSRRADHDLRGRRPEPAAVAHRDRGRRSRWRRHGRAAGTRRRPV